MKIILKRSRNECYPFDLYLHPHRGSTFGNKGAWAAAVGAVSADAATAVEKEKNWRHKYTK